jgi:hypothetical protein
MSHYIPIEYPKWVEGVLVRNVEEERALRTAVADALADARANERARPPSAAGVRMRRTRERRREGKMSIRCDITAAQIEALCKAGLIDPFMRDDATEVARGIGRSLDGLTP